MRDLSRRDLLRATAVGAGAVAIPSMIAGSSAIAADGPGWPSDTKFPPAQLTGRIVRPGDPEYAEASLGWDELFVHHPLVIVFAQETQDVVNALTWARQNDVALRVRSGRHNLEGWSNVDNGIVIDVSGLKSAHIDTASHIATVGAGLNQVEAVDRARREELRGDDRHGGERRPGRRDARRRLRLPHPLPRHGLRQPDRSRDRRRVGHRRRQGDQGGPGDHPDLLWALRGAGNGNFGIVTSLTYKVAPAEARSRTASDLDRASATCTGSSTPGSARRRTPTTVSATQLEVHKPRDPAVRGSRGRDGGRGQEAAGPDPVGRQPYGHGDRSASWGDIYAGFQIPTQKEPANWKFFSQFITEPFPRRRSTSSARSWRRPLAGQQLLHPGLRRGGANA